VYGHVDGRRHRKISHHGTISPDGPSNKPDTIYHVPFQGLDHQRILTHTISSSTGIHFGMVFQIGSFILFVSWLLVLESVLSSASSSVDWIKACGWTLAVEPRVERAILSAVVVVSFAVQEC
jgi:hypothetical protein